MAELETDRELLTEYAEHGSESAFQALVERHLDVVFATAFRGLNDTGAAEEITQNVFETLARKAARLRGETSVIGWLHITALFEVRCWWRAELRRRRREQTALERGTIMKEEDSLFKSLAGELDEGLLGLGEADRQALMLRYFEGRSHREIGALLGAREDAVRMRINKALARLTRFFRRRGYAVSAVATTVALLGTAAKAAPAGLAIMTTRSALATGAGGSVTGLKLLITKLMSLTKTQTTILCVTLAVAPMVWEWNINRVSRNGYSDTQSKLQAVHNEMDQSTTDIGRLRAESTRLDAALADTMNNQTRYEAAAGKLGDLKARVRGLLTDADYQWPDDLPYVRVSKALIKSLDVLNRWPGTFSPSGTLTDPAQELFAITAEEKGPTEQALANYWRGVEELMTASAYETNLPSVQTGRLTKTVIVPPLGQPVKALAEETRTRLSELLGPERTKLLFEGWDQGGIQIFWPGNLWNVSEVPQTFTAWVEPAATNTALRYGFGWHQGFMGTSSDAFPRGIATQFFLPWLEQFKIPVPSRFFGEPHE